MGPSRFSRFFTMVHSFTLLSPLSSPFARATFLANAAKSRSDGEGGAEIALVYHKSALYPLLVYCVQNMTFNPVPPVLYGHKKNFYVCSL
ncbi:hypothetical protein GQ43DRAFT_93156 [Delitschia confertaspora ATCC 74209]|uniref:Secreted protein n=1 Tax=Delitschia confertaspora ATCC 74209 TaxID=1513339 RepID=A0A9P4N3P0_9PLEO|nr:hypothetical protein GQ43DRAFT_93156 [Delitschia confertaspora ATCC 74209]